MPEGGTLRKGPPPLRGLWEASLLCTCLLETFRASIPHPSDPASCPFFPRRNGPQYIPQSSGSLFGLSEPTQLESTCYTSLAPNINWLLNFPQRKPYLYAFLNTFWSKVYIYTCIVSVWDFKDVAELFLSLFKMTTIIDKSFSSKQDFTMSLIRKANSEC